MPVAQSSVDPLLRATQPSVASTHSDPSDTEHQHFSERDFITSLPEIGWGGDLFGIVVTSSKENQQSLGPGARLSAPWHREHGADTAWPRSVCAIPSGSWEPTRKWCKSPAGIFPGATLIWMRDFNSTEVSHAAELASATGCSSGMTNLLLQLWSAFQTCDALQMGCTHLLQKCCFFSCPWAGPALAFVYILGLSLSSMDRRQAWAQMPAWDYCRVLQSVAFSIFSFLWIFPSCFLSNNFLPVSLTS